MSCPLILVLYISIVASVSAPTHLLVTRAGPCYDAQKTTISVSELSLSTQTLHSLLSGEFNISEDITNGWKIKATMQKCVDIRNMETCDLYRTYNLVQSGCSDEDESESGQQMYGLLFQYTHPKLECPIQAGRYKLVDYPLFMQDNHVIVRETKISTSVFGYTFRLDGFIKRRKIFCIEAILQLMYTRKHDWADRTNVKEPISRTATTAGEEV